MKEKIKNILNDKNLWIFTAIVLIFFGVFLRMEFAVDSYATLTFSLKQFFNQFASSGRFLLIIAGGLLKILKIKPEVVYVISFITAIICMIVSLYKLYTIIEKDIKSKTMKIILPVLIILNAFSIELFLFIEKGIMIFSVMMSVFAVGEIKKWLEDKEKKHLIKTFIYMLLSNFSYQGVVGIFIAIAIIYILKYSKNIKEFIINNIVVALSYGIPAIIDYVLIKIVCKSSRVSGNIIWSESLKKVGNSTLEMIKSTYRILPKYFLLILIIVLLGLIIYQILTKKVDTKFKLIDLSKILYIIAAVIIGAVAPQLMQNTDSIWFVARSTYSYASLFGILSLYAFMNYDIKIYVKYIILTMSAILLVVQFYRFNIIETDRYKLNAIDYQITKEISEEIDKYEKDTGNKITKISIYEDKMTGYTYSGIFATGDTNIKAYMNNWSILYILKYYCGRDLKEAENDPEIEEEFKNYNWENFEKGQLKFKGDTLCLCKF